MQAAARLAPKDAMIFYKLAVIQSKRGEWDAGIKSVSVAQKLGLPKNLEDATSKTLQIPRCACLRGRLGMT